MITVTVAAPNAVPTANAGSDLTVVSGANVTLDGSASVDPDGDIATYRWQRASGNEAGTGDDVVLSGADTATPGFTAQTLTSDDVDVTYVFELVVTDHDNVHSDVDTVTVTVSAPQNARPVADAGTDQTVASGATVVLDGSASSDSDGDIATYQWQRVIGDDAEIRVNLTGADTAHPRFVAETLVQGDADVSHVFELVVTDNDGESSIADTVSVTVLAPASAFVNARPVANAGPDREVVSGTTVILDGSASSDDEEISKFAWTRTYGSGDRDLVLTGANTERLTFTADTLDVGASGVTHYFTLWVTDDEGLSAFDTVTVTVVAPLAHPVANAGPDQTVRSGAIVTLDGSASRDDDGTITSFNWIRESGTAGDVALAGADTANPTFTAETVAVGAPSVTYQFILFVRDNDDLNSPYDRVTITVTAPNVAPTANAGSDQTVDSGATVTLDGSASSDIEGKIATYTWKRATGSNAGTGAEITLTGADTASPTFTAQTLTKHDDDVTYVLELVVTDEDGVNSNTDRVTVTVSAPPNKPPIADAGPDQTVVSGATVTLDGSASDDPDGTITDYNWDWRIGESTSDRNPVDTTPGSKDPTISFTADTLDPGDADVTHVFALSVHDDDGAPSDFDTVTVTVTAPNVVPVANAGPDQTVVSGAAVTLDGSASSDHDGDIVTYTWQRATGNNAGTGNKVTLSGEDTASPTFTAQSLTSNDQNVTYVFELVVTDQDGDNSIADKVTITVTPPPNSPPVADAGPDQTVVSGATVTLDGSASDDPDGTITDYNWDWRLGESTSDRNPVGTTPGSKDPTISFTADTLDPGDADVTHVFALSVHDDDGAPSDFDTVTVTVTAPNVVPVANAGPDQTVVSGAAVTLDGSASSDHDGDIVTYTWQRATGNNAGTGNKVTLSGEDTASPTFTAQSLTSNDQNVTYVFELVVTDQDGDNSIVDKVTITVTPPPNSPPVADAGPDQTVVSGATVTLDGSASDDPDGTITDYNWDWRIGESTSDRNPVGTTPGSKDPTISFTADTLDPGDADVIHVFALSVHDDDGAPSDFDTVTVTVTAPNVVPVANAGPDQTVVSGAAVTLDGSASSDHDGDIVTYTWQRATGNNAGTGNKVTLSGEDTASPTFTAQSLTSNDQNVTYVFELVVTDQDGDNSIVDKVTITVTPPPNSPPVADAGPDQTVVSGATVRLDGSASDDPDGTITDYNWDWRLGESTSDRNPVGTTPGSKDPTISFTADTLDPGDADVTHVFALSVHDDDGAPSGFDTVTVTVTAPNGIPVANAGPDQTVNSGATVTLDGSASSDIEGKIATYLWERATGSDAGTGNKVTLTGEDTAAPTFVAQTLTSNDADVTYVFKLTVTDSDDATNTDKVTITVSAPPNARPIVDAGPDQTVQSGALVVLDGSGSHDPDGKIVEWRWFSGLIGIGEVSLTNGDTVSPSFTAQIVTVGAPNGRHSIILQVRDDDGIWSASDYVDITVTDLNNDPVADAGPDLTVVAGKPVTLTGNGADQDGDIESWVWKRTGGTGDGSVIPDPVESGTLTFTPETLLTGETRCYPYS